jgi:small conductance mechanosensitive channel
MNLETIGQALNAPGALLVLIGRLALVLLIYSLGVMAFRAWARTDEYSRSARQVLHVLWFAAMVVVALSVAAFTLDLNTIEPLFTWGNDLSSWFSGRVLSVAATLAVAYLAMQFVNLITSRLTAGTAFTRQNVRIDTLRGVLASALRALIVVAAFVAVLSELGVNVTALLAGVSILGLAVSFGAQSLVKDVITGFFILLEDQYGVGDVVRVNGPGGLAGGVEAVSLRTTVLRDLEGTAHVIPNGEIKTVSVLSKDWARAVADIDVPYDVSLDQMLELLTQVATALHDDPEWNNKFLEPPEVLGVQALTPTAVTLRVLMKVQPKEQWPVSREFRRRMKNALDKAGLRVPLPQMSLAMPPQTQVVMTDTESRLESRLSENPEPR